MFLPGKGQAACRDGALSTPLAALWSSRTEQFGYGDLIPRFSYHSWFIFLPNNPTSLMLACCKQLSWCCPQKLKRLTNLRIRHFLCFACCGNASDSAQVFLLARTCYSKMYELLDTPRSNSMARILSWVVKAITSVVDGALRKQEGFLQETQVRLDNSGSQGIKSGQEGCCPQVIWRMWGFLAQAGPEFLSPFLRVPNPFNPQNT